MLLLVKNILVKKEVWDLCCLDATASSFVARVRGEVFAHFHAVAVKRHSSMRNWLFRLLGRILYEVPLMSNEHALDIVFFGLPWTENATQTTIERLMLSSPSACLTISKFSVALFLKCEQNLMLFLCRIHREIASGQIILYILFFYFILFFIFGGCILLHSLLGLYYSGR
jgi:hypothetical protein